MNELVKRAASEHDHARRRAIEERTMLEQAERAVARAEEAQEIVQEVAAAVQERAHRQIASVVTKCLESVFDDPYRFSIEFEQKRGKTDAVLLFERDGAKIDPLTASGGGVVDVAAFALRLASLLLSAPQRRRVLILDEPFRFVSRDLRDKVRQMLETLAEELEIQFVVVTHDPALVAGKVVEL